MEGFVFDLQRFASEYTITSDVIGNHKSGYLRKNGSNNIEYVENDNASNIIAKITGANSIVVHKDTKITFKFAALFATGTYNIYSTESGYISGSPTLRGLVRIKGSGVATPNGEGLTIDFSTNSYGTKPAVSGFDADYDNAFEISDCYNLSGISVNYSVQKSYDGSTFVAASSPTGNTRVIVGASNVATNDDYDQAFSEASLSLADVLRAAKAVNYTGNLISIRSYDSATHNTIWSNAGAGIGNLMINSGDFFLLILAIK